jgi:hypothetical protein
LASGSASWLHAVSWSRTSPERTPPRCARRTIELALLPASRPATSGPRRRRIVYSARLPQPARSDRSVVDHPPISYHCRCGRSGSKHTSTAAGCSTPPQGPRAVPAHGGGGARRMVSSWSPITHPKRLPANTPEAVTEDPSTCTPPCARPEHAIAIVSALSGDGSPRFRRSSLNSILIRPRESTPT